jgi:ABC-type branched-subunit amino acid transport system substrate-binding protein
MSRSAAAIGIVAAAAIAVAACGTSSGGGGSTGSSKGTYTIGMSSLLSGPFGFVGVGLKNGAEAYFNYVNKHGGVDGYQLKLVALDDQSETSNDLTNIKTLVSQDGAIGVIGLALSSTSTAAVPLGQQLNVPMLFEGLASGTAAASNKVIFGAEVQEAGSAPSIVAFAKQNLASKFGASPKVAVVTQTGSPALATVANQLVSGAKANGWQVALNLGIPQTATTYTTYAHQIANAKPDFILMGMAGQSVVGLVNAMKEIGLSDPSIVDYFGGGGSNILQQINDSNYYAMQAFNESPGTPAQTGMALYNKNMKAMGFNPAEADEVNGYVEALIVGSALKACGAGCTGTKLTTALNSLNHLDTGGLSVGPVSYSATNHDGLNEVMGFQWDASKRAAVSVGSPLPFA